MKKILLPVKGVKIMISNHPNIIIDLKIIDLKVIITDFRGNLINLIILRI